MRLAHVYNQLETLPPSRLSGGAEVSITQLITGLRKHGEHVTYFGAPGSTVADRVVSTTARPLGIRALEEGKGIAWWPFYESELEARNWAQLLRERERYDVVHTHWVHGSGVANFADALGRPMVVTFRIADDMARESREAYAAYPNVTCVAISQAQATLLGCERVIPNGVDTQRFTLSTLPRTYLLCVGRIVPEKGIDVAVRVAEAAGIPLVLVGSVYDYVPASKELYKTVVIPAIRRGTVRHYDFVPHTRMPALYGGALATLFPIRWDEAFGNVVVESQATGTPVIGFARGAVPELIDHGTTGFVVRDEQEMLAAVPDAVRLAPAACRERVQRLYPLDRTVDAYRTLYHELT